MIAASEDDSEMLRGLACTSSDILWLASRSSRRLVKVGRILCGEDDLGEASHAWWMMLRRRRAQHPPHDVPHQLLHVLPHHLTQLG